MAITGSRAHVFGWLAKIAAAGCALINTRLLFELLGTTPFAAFSIIIAMGPWLALMQLGLAGASQNAISARRAAGADLAAFSRSATTLAMTVWVLMTGVACLLSVPMKAWTLNGYAWVPITAILLMFAGMLSTAVSAIFNQMLLALDQPLWPNVAPGIQAFATTLALLAARWIQPTDSFMVAAVAFAAPMLLTTVISSALCGSFDGWQIRKRDARELMLSCRGFMLFAVASTATLSADMLILSQLLEAHEIATYSLVSRIIGVMLSLHGVVLANAWPKLAVQHAAGKRDEFMQQLRSTLGLGAITTVLPTAILLMAGDLVFSALGASALTPVNPTTLIAGFAYLCVRVWTDSFAVALLSTGRALALGSFVVVQMLVSVTAQWLLASRYGAAGAFAGIAVSFLLTAAWIIPHQVLRRKTA